MPHVSFRAMACEMNARVENDAPEALLALEEVCGWFEDWERTLSRFQPGSELSRFNRTAGEWVRVGETLWLVVLEAIAAAQATQGLVTPLALRAVEAAGYDRSFELIGSQPAGGTAPRVPDWRALDWDTRARALRVPPGAGLDLGGIAKGWAADQSAKRLSAHGPALVDAGGDIAVSGPRRDGEPWPIEVEVASTLDIDVPPIMLASGGVATSGRDYRRWVRDGTPQHHIIDPSTGRPAESDVLSATVVAPSAREAEAAAKAVLILGSERGLQWLDDRAWLAGLVVLDSGEVRKSRTMDAHLWKV